MIKKIILLTCGIVMSGVCLLSTQPAHAETPVLIGLSPASVKILIVKEETRDQKIQVWGTETTKDQQYRVDIITATGTKTLVNGPKFVTLKKGETVGFYTYKINAANIPTGEYTAQIVMTTVPMGTKNADTVQLNLTFTETATIKVVDSAAEIPIEIDRSKVETALKIKNFQADKKMLLWGKTVRVSWDLKNLTDHPIDEIPYNLVFSRDMLDVRQIMGKITERLGPHETRTETMTFALAEPGDYTFVLRIGNISDRTSVIKIKPLTILLQNIPIVALLFVLLVAITFLIRIRTAKNDAQKPTVDQNESNNLFNQ